VVRIVLVLLLIACLYIAVKSARDVRPATRKRLGNWGGLSLLGIILAFVFLRFGFHWLTVLGAGVAATLRIAAPLAWRLLPFAQQIHSQRSARPAGDGARKEGPQSRREPPPRRAERMSRDEALAVLGLKAPASREQILAAYKELMKRVHPDKPGGSNYLARKVNEAKDALLA
jgi:hypothetical protein